jgi:hypothetical protein
VVRSDQNGIRKCAKWKDNGKLGAREGGREERDHVDGGTKGVKGSAV